MKKKSKKIITLLCALLLILAIGTGGYTYAKYRTSVKGGGQADVAKWVFSVGKGNEQITNIKLTDTVDESTLVNGKIAPGTNGEFSIYIDATGSEVGIDYDVKFSNEKNKPTNLTFSYNGKNYNSLAEIANDIKGKINVDAISKTARITIKWSWGYETGTGEQIAQNDNIDTQEGITALNYTFDVVVTGTQSKIV